MKINAKKVIQKFFQKRLTLATAESCSGGLLSSTLTDYSGSSRFFLSGITAYHNKEKTRLLKIPAMLINKYGAVSKEIAVLMAEKCSYLAKSDIAVSTTGIAGPTGGSIEKPVGTVFIAVKFKNGLICRKFLFKGTRLAIKKQTVTKALELLDSCL